MGKFIEVAKESDITESTMKEVVAEGHEILLAKAGGSYYATSNRCPHMGAKLSEGKLEGFVVICPRHGSQFDLRDGRIIGWASKMPSVISAIGKVIKRPRPLTTYPVKREGGKILVDIQPLVSQTGPH